MVRGGRRAAGRPGTALLPVRADSVGAQQLRPDSLSVGRGGRGGQAGRHRPSFPRKSGRAG